MTPMIAVKKLNKSFKVGEQTVSVLKDINFEIERGDFVIIFGPSGCGKSTLLHTLLGLEPPSSGSVMTLDQSVYGNIGTKSEDERAEFRKRHIGMVYQQANWIKSLSVVENVMFPLKLLGMELDKTRSQSETILNSMGMSEHKDYVPSELSSGQQQKVALARALVTNPEIIIADEPTGNLDFESGRELMLTLTKLNRELKKTVVMVTHDLEYLSYAKTAIRMFDGALVGIYKDGDKHKLMNEIKGKRGSK